MNSIVIPNSVTKLGSSAFEGCTSLSSVVISNSINTLDSYVFSGCSKLTDVIIPDSVTQINPYAFYCCTSLKSIILPENVCKVLNNAFDECNNLEKVTVLNSEVYFNLSIFNGCDKLILYGFESSTTQTYAEEYELPFIALDTVELTKISIYSMPNKQIYYVGDSLDISGLKLLLTYSDGSTEIISNGFTTSGFSSTSDGTKMVTVSYNGKTTTFTITVNTPSISLSSTSKSMTVGDTDSLTATTTPSGQTVTWTSSNTSVATVSGGTITAKASGSATITAAFSYNGITYSDNCEMTICSHNHSYTSKITKEATCITDGIKT